MVDEKKNISPDDEYQFPQDEYISPDTSSQTEADLQAAPAASPASSRSRVSNFLKKVADLPVLKNKRIIVVAAVVILVIIVIRIVNMGSTKPAVPQPVAQQSVQQPVTTQMNGGISSSLSSLQVDTSQTTSQIRQLQSQLADMQTVISQLQESNQQLRQSMVFLNSQLKDLSDELAKAMADMPRKAAAAQVTYHLRAVLPDRAWITSSAGQTRSITVGDTIKQYGTVRAIDAVNGVVITSSGRKIEYGSNDR